MAHISTLQVLLQAHSACHARLDFIVHQCQSTRQHVPRAIMQTLLGFKDPTTHNSFLPRWLKVLGDANHAQEVTTALTLR